MPLVKQRGLLLIGNFSFQVNSKVGHDMWFNNAPWGPPDSWATSFLDIGQKGRRQVMRLLSADQEFRAEPGEDRRGKSRQAQHACRVRPGLSRQHGGVLQHHPRAQGCQARYRLCRVLSAGLGRNPCAP
jgi:hypothetical protein